MISSTRLGSRSTGRGGTSAASEAAGAPVSAPDGAALPPVFSVVMRTPAEGFVPSAFGLPPLMRTFLLRNRP